MHFDRLARTISIATGRPWALALAVAVILVWATTGPVFNYSDTWQLIINTGTTIITFVMVFVLQASQNRDAAAIQAKLDELIRAHGEARNTFVALDDQPSDVIERAREEAREAARQEVQNNNNPLRPWWNE
jgi:low affinity Fe/Cu permease